MTEKNSAPCGVAGELSGDILETVQMFDVKKNLGIESDLVLCSLCGRDVISGGGPHMLDIPDESSLICGFCAMSLEAASTRTDEVFTGVLPNGRPVRIHFHRISKEREMN